MREWAGSTLGRLGAGALLSMVVALPSVAETLAERENRGLVEIVTSGVDGSDLRMAAEVASIVDDGATRRVVPVVGKGSVQNLVDVRVLRGVDFALVQTDVLAQARKRGAGIEKSISYVAKLYNAEFHLLARNDVQSVEQLRGKKVSFDVAGSGSSVTGPAVLQLLGVPVEATTDEPLVALDKLRSGEIAALGFVAAKPAPLFFDPRIGKDVHFLPIPLRPDAVADYLPSRLTSDDYPALVGSGQAVDTVAVGVVLVVANLQRGTLRYRNAAYFTETFFTQFQRLLEPPRSAKWHEVNLATELPGWRRFEPAQTWLKQNAAPAPEVADRELYDMFTKFLDQRSRAVRGRPLTQQQKDEMFNEFRQWQGQGQPGPAAQSQR
jgi:TRAP-type uncharacterized transport system substrate-binding protein